MAASCKLSIKSISPPNRLGEGPHWDIESQSLYYVDIYKQKILRYHPETDTITTATFKYGPVGVVIPVKGSPGKLIVASGQDVLLVTWDGKKDTTDPPYEKLASLDVGKSDTRVNDGKCDPAGRFWIGTMANEHDGNIADNEGSLYRLDQDLNLEKILSPVSISNGLAWTKDKDNFYYIDSPTRQVFGFDYDLASGKISNKRVVFEFEKHNITGVPDGMTIDSDDNIWVAVHNGASVLQVNPKTGDLLRTVELPADRITSVAFGGPKLSDLYVTSAYQGLTEKQRNEKKESGCTFVIKGLGVKGVPAHEFIIKK